MTRWSFIFWVICYFSCHLNVYACKNSDWLFSLPSEQKIFLRSEMAQMDRELRYRFINTLHGEGRAGSTSEHAETLIKESLDYILAHSKHDIFQMFNFLGKLYVLGMINFDEYLKLKARNTLGERRTRLVIGRLKWLQKNRVKLVKWTEQFGPKEEIQSGTHLDWRCALCNVDNGLGHFFDTLKIKLPFTVEPFSVTEPIIRTNVSTLLRIRLDFDGLPLHNELVVKLSEYSSLHEELEYFSRMEMIASQLLHRPGILTPFGFFRFQTRTKTIDMKFMPLLPKGGDLSEIAKDLSIREALFYLAKAVDELIYAQDLGVMHNDIKLGNIYADNMGRVYLLDFGAATFGIPNVRRMAKDGDYSWFPPAFSDRIDGSILNEGFILSSELYIPPEILKFGMNAHTEASQVYMLGITLGELIPPHRHDEMSKPGLEAFTELFFQAVRDEPEARPLLRQFRDRLRQLIVRIEGEEASRRQTSQENPKPEREESGVHPLFSGG